MTYVLLGGVVLLAALAAYQYLRNVDPRLLRNGARWGVGGLLAVVTAALALFRRMDIALVTGALAVQVWRTGRIGPFSLDGIGGKAADTSKVRSRYFEMHLDHDTGAVTGKVLAGQFANTDLIGLDEMQTRALIEEIEWDPDSVSLLESWLDSNRAGWREYFAESAAQGTGSQQAESDPLAEAYAVLGLQPGANADAIRSAHRELMKGVHPDRGGSSYLASKINEARDQLLRQFEGN